MDLPALISNFLSVGGTHARVLFLSASQGQASEYNMRFAIEVLRQYGAHAVGFGQRVWEIEEQRFEFISAQLGLKPLLQELRRDQCHIVLLSHPEDFGEEWSLLQPALKLLHESGQANIWMLANRL